MLGIQSFVSLSIHFLPFVSISILDSWNFLHPHRIRWIPALRHPMHVFDILGMRCGIDDFERITHTERLFPWLRLRFVRLLRKLFSGTQFLRFHSQDNVFISSWSIQCVSCMELSLASTFQLHSHRSRDFHNIVQLV